MKIEIHLTEADSTGLCTVGFDSMGIDVIKGRYMLYLILDVKIYQVTEVSQIAFPVACGGCGLPMRDYVMATTGKHWTTEPAYYRSHCLVPAPYHRSL